MPVGQKENNTCRILVALIRNAKTPVKFWVGNAVFRSKWFKKSVPKLLLPENLQSTIIQISLALKEEINYQASAQFLS